MGNEEIENPRCGLVFVLRIDVDGGVVENRGFERGEEEEKKEEIENPGSRSKSYQAARHPIAHLKIPP